MSKISDDKMGFKPFYPVKVSGDLVESDEVNAEIKKLNRYNRYNDSFCSNIIEHYKRVILG